MKKDFDYFVYNSRRNRLTLYKNGKMVGGFIGNCAKKIRQRILAEGREAARV